MADLKTTGIAGATGALGGVGVNFLAKQFPWIAQNWWATPAVLLVGGHVARRWSNTAGLGLAAVGGYLFAQNWLAGGALMPGAKGADAAQIDQRVAEAAEEMDRMTAGAHEYEGADDAGAIMEATKMLGAKGPDEIGAVLSNLRAAEAAADAYDL